MEAILVAGGSREERIGCAREHMRARQQGRPGPLVWCDPDPAGWPFRRHVAENMPARDPIVVWVDDLERAFPNWQAGGTRLVLTQSTYLVQKWLDVLGARRDAMMVATADAVALRRVAPEAFAGRGPWHRFLLLTAGPASASAATSEFEIQMGTDAAETEPLALEGRDAAELLRLAFSTPSPRARLEACRRAAALQPEWAVAHLALASACMEHQDLGDARDALAAAAALAPDWEAVHFERGKLWLRLDEVERASEAFAEAASRMPTFSAALSNFGAALGELGRPRDGLEAFRQALAHDPLGFNILNNIGVVSRELGQLDDSEAALRRVVAVAPDFVFGHYNLGRTLFLQGRFEEAVEAYGEGRRRDGQRNPRQAMRLALARLGAGDAGGALRDARDCLANAPASEKPAMLAEAREVAGALLARRPGLAGGDELVSMIGQALAEAGS